MSERQTPRRKFSGELIRAVLGESADVARQSDASVIGTHHILLAALHSGGSELLETYLQKYLDFAALEQLIPALTRSCPPKDLEATDNYRYTFVSPADGKTKNIGYKVSRFPEASSGMRLSINAIRAYTVAQAAVAELGHNRVTFDHIFWALLQDSDNAATVVLEEAGIDTLQLKSSLQAVLVENNL